MLRLLSSCLLLVACAGTQRSVATIPAEEAPGGATTVADSSATGFGRAVRNLRPERWLEMLAGKRIFQRVWTSDAQGSGSGLGPMFNGRSCNDCHFRDGRGGRPHEATPDVRLLARLARAGTSDPDLVYGSQLSEQAAPGLQREGRLAVDYVAEVMRFADGQARELRRPRYRVEGESLGALSTTTGLSARTPGTLVGLGLLEAISAADIVRRADPDDRDGDGISGRASWVPGDGSSARTLGRFGWKATQPTVRAQIATALREDMGLTSWLRPQSACTRAEAECALRDRSQEVSARELEQVTNYVRLLGVPARRDAASSEVRRGQTVFHAVGCDACHTPRQVTAPDLDLPELASQTIFPYTDLLLHDLGDALADPVADGSASGREWRTPPLWGIGMLATIHGRTRLLHDGRARDVEEAVLWHAGEAAGARARYQSLPSDQRQNLVRFVESL